MRLRFQPVTLDNKSSLGDFVFSLEFETFFYVDLGYFLVFSAKFYISEIYFKIANFCS